MVNIVRRIRIDFSGGSSQPRIGLLMLLLAMLSVVWSIQEYRHLDSIRQALLAKIVAAKHKLDEKKPDLQTSSIKQAVRAQWGQLIGSLEQADAKNVKLISLESNRELRSITITADAITVEAMINYVQTLTAQSILHNVKLNEHQVHEDEEDKLIRFVITANWNEV